MYGLILSDGGMTNVGINRMAKLYDTITHHGLLRKLNDMAKRYNVDLNKFVEFGIVLDNVDMYVKPRAETAKTSNTMHHMVQAIAVEERVQPSVSDSNCPAIPVENIQPKDIIPSLSDSERLKELMVKEVLRIWSEMPALKNVDFEEAEETHQYTAQMSQPSNLVSERTKS